MRFCGASALSVLGLLVLAALVVSFFWIQMVLNTPLDWAKGTVIEVEKGDTARDLVERLKAKGLVGDGFLLLLYMKLTGLDKRIRPARVRVEASDTLGDLIMRIVRYRRPQVEVVVWEGMDLFDVADLLDRSGIVRKGEFLSYAMDESVVEGYGLWGRTLEGYLFPDTYLFFKDSTPREVVDKMIDNFKKKALPLLLRATLLDPYKTLIVASLVQKETYVPDEMPVVAGVIYNRLMKGMLLQIDPTVIYAYRLKYGDAVRVRLTREKLRIDSPYNTYRVKGLPETPICNPGLDAIRAALRPAETPYLYFVAVGNGTHHFSKTLREHLRAVRRYRKAHGGVR